MMRTVKLAEELRWAVPLGVARIGTIRRFTAEPVISNPPLMARGFDHRALIKVTRMCLVSLDH